MLVVEKNERNTEDENNTDRTLPLRKNEDAVLLITIQFLNIVN